MAGQRILPDVIVKSFKKCCISNAVDEAGDYMLWNDSKEDGNAWGECEKDEGTDCGMETVALIGKSR